MYPTLIVHADWSVSVTKRCMASAFLNGPHQYHVNPPEPVGELGTFLDRLQEKATPQGCVFLGFDFPIGLPLVYARKAAIDDYLEILPELGRNEWSDFYSVAENPGEVGLGRPFYPQRPGNSRQQHLLDGLGEKTIDDLRRQCELGRPGRRSACPLFWTMGGQQVGKAAITGWKYVLGPALRKEQEQIPASRRLALWPFSGRLRDLFKPGYIVIAETYPAEFYTHLNLTFSNPGAKSRLGKRHQLGRSANSHRLLAWTQEADIILEPGLRDAILDGFGPSGAGEDAFDALVGLFGMLNVVLGFRSEGEPPNEEIRSVEGWILGQTTAQPR